MKKPIINVVTFTPFIISMIFWIISTQKSYIDANGLEHGFAYLASTSLFFILGIIIVCIRLGVSFIKKKKIN